HGYTRSLGEGCDLVADDEGKRPPDQAARLERVRQLAEHAVEFPDPCLEVVDPRDADRLTLGRQKLGELSPDEEEISAEGCDVLERPVVEVERQATEPTFARADERALPRCAPLEHELALDDRAHRCSCLREVDADRLAALDTCAGHE